MPLPSVGTGWPATSRRQTDWRARPAGPRRARLAGAASAGTAVPRFLPFLRRAGCCRGAASRRASARDLRERQPEMAAQPADELSPPGLARSGSGCRISQPATPHLGGGHSAGVARSPAGRRHLGRGQPPVACRRGSADPARPVRCDARGWAAARCRAGDRRGLSHRTSRPAGAPPRRGERQGGGGQAGRRPDHRR